MRCTLLTTGQLAWLLCRLSRLGRGNEAAAHLDACIEEAPQPVGEDAGLGAHKNAHKCGPEDAVACMNPLVRELLLLLLLALQTTGYLELQEHQQAVQLPGCSTRHMV